ncbi:DTW domain-containing protein [Simiduia sp. 21SJ11W-1]|uniref:tRNA-uridine aminocarboxypropyltransferase n=1 Tax=Simiduia sp. 21SJ11W-1 TaxID=2909669 RepID=UPI00209EC541|nr:tRNA-uridine aminocarboxypropyltransferase [Simiduia sp. 21SJ11W-1]UTA47862.1 DTW domain-containing protein [Simiduia sp. 21SJ11W-1]
MRALCPHCRLPRTHCLCDSAPQLSPRTQLVVLQHPSESQHPKNTLRLARLCLPELRLAVGETPEDFMALAKWLAPTRACLLYPDDHSQPLEQYANPVPEVLVFIDATWRKAYKMLALNPWLQGLPRCHFNAAPAGDYRLRKTRRAGGLSTLEAIAYGLNCVEGTDFSALNELQARWVERMQSFMPEDVKARYEPK